MSTLKQHPGNVGSNFHFLFLKQFLAEIKTHQPELQALVKENVDLEIVLELAKYPLENQKAIFNDLYEGVLKGQPWVGKIVGDLSEKLLGKSKELYQFQTQRNYFLVQNFRQTCNPPLCKSQPQNCYNLSSLFKVNINKELRRTIWSKCLFTEPHKQQFFKYDHKVIPYNLTEQLTIGLVRLSQENGLKLKENQKDCCLRVLEYVVKKWDKIPNRSQQYLVLNVVNVYAHYTPARVMEIGAVFVGLKDITEYYFQADVSRRLELIQIAFELVDPETYKMIQTCYLPYSEKSNSDLNQVFEHFRLTLSTAFFPLPASQYIIDQILIKKQNKLDIYIIFSLLTMIMSDDLQKYKESKLPLTDIINAENTKKTIKLDDVVDAFRVIYEGVGPYHRRKGDGEVNRLLERLIEFDSAGEMKKMEEGAPGGSVPVSLKVIEPEDRMAGFVVEQKGAVLRLGTKKDIK